MFVTHGGQNSFMESMFVGTPLVVCPGFADQPANGAKAQAMKVGLCVDRLGGIRLLLLSLLLLVLLLLLL